MRDIELAVKLHGAKTIILIIHEDCGAYRNNKYLNINHPDDEKFFQLFHLKQVHRILKHRFPDINIRLLMAKKIYKTPQWTAEELALEN